MFKNPDMITKLQATTKSLLINCEYTLEVKTTYDAICSKTPNCSTQVLMYVPEFKEDLNALKPADWNPQVMPVYNFNVIICDSNYQDENYGNNNNQKPNQNETSLLNQQIPQSNNQFTPSKSIEHPEVVEVMKNEVKNQGDNEIESQSQKVEEIVVQVNKENNNSETLKR